MTGSSTSRPNKKNLSLRYDRSTAEQLFIYIRDEIVCMDLLPGQKIPETQLALEFGVSRTPVREAIFKLANLGFVEVLPQRGTFVTLLSKRKIMEAQFIREALEISVMRLLISNITPTLIQECRDIIAQQEKAAEQRNPMQFLKLDDDFHQYLANASGYSRVADLIEIEKYHLSRVRNLSLLDIEDQYQTVIQQHLAIVDGLASGDPTAAVNAMQLHMKEVFKILHSAPELHPDFFDNNTQT